MLILGGGLFVAIFAFGLIVIFDDNMFSNLARGQRIGFGSLIIIYAFLRFFRILKKREDEI